MISRNDGHSITLYADARGEAGGETRQREPPQSARKLSPCAIDSTRRDIRYALRRRQSRSSWRLEGDLKEKGEERKKERKKERKETTLKNESHPDGTPSLSSPLIDDSRCISRHAIENCARARSIDRVDPVDIASSFAHRYFRRSGESLKCHTGPLLRLRHRPQRSLADNQ